MLDQILAPFEFFSSDTLILLPLLICLEAVLSADNAIALAAIAQNLPDEKLQRSALNLGLVVAFSLRVLLILTATWVTQFWQFELAGALYLLWLVVQHFFLQGDSEEEIASRQLHSLWAAIPLIALTDLAFSLDSVTTAIALSKETWLVITGGAIGVITLRFMAGLFIRWLKEYVYLEDAGYVAVALVGSRLLLRVIHDAWVPPDWAMVAMIALVFIWGFSKRVEHDGGSGEFAGAEEAGSDGAEEVSVPAIAAVAVAPESHAPSPPESKADNGVAEVASDGRL